MPWLQLVAKRVFPKSVTLWGSSHDYESVSVTRGIMDWHALSKSTLLQKENMFKIMN